jgi:DNA-binding transcriptional MerR regulator
MRTEIDPPAGPLLTVGRAARVARVSVRTLHHYDQLGLLTPSVRSEAGYRRYSSADLERLQLILFYRELGFGLAEIERLLSDPALDRRTALLAQRDLLVEQEHRTHRLLDAVNAALEADERGFRMTKEEMFEVFGDIDPAQYEDEVKERWGETDAYRESTKRSARYTKADWQRMSAESDEIEAGFAALAAAGASPDSAEAMALAERHRLHIDDWFYPCSHEMQAGLAEMYVADDRFRAHYDDRAPGLAQFVHDAIAANARRAAAPGAG